MTLLTPISSTLNLPIIDLAIYLKDPNSDGAKAECKKAAKALLDYSALAVRDPNCTEQENSSFLDLMEDYFSQSTELKLKDSRPEYSFQVGCTPAHKEVPKCGNDANCLEMVENMKPENKPGNFNEPDPKWRFFHRIGEPPKITQFKTLNIDPVVPEAFPEWLSVMNGWGGKLHDAVLCLSEMLAIGFDLPKDAFSKMTQNAPHLLAPTGSDLSLFGKVGDVLAGFHYDLNFLTIHGKSRFPGLNIWARDGSKLLAKIPDGCLLVQAAKQFEWLTGGYIKAGYHEVVVAPETVLAMEMQEERGRPLWRISSTLFFHINSDQILRPLAHFAKECGAIKNYPAILTGDQVRNELGLIELMKEN